LKYPVARRDMAETRVVLKDRTNGAGWSYNVLPLSLCKFTEPTREAAKILVF